MNKFLLAGLIGGALLGGAGGAYFASRSHVTAPEILEIRQALARRQFRDAVDLASRRLALKPNDVHTRLMLGEAWQQQREFEKAAAAYEEIPQTAGETALAARVATASMALQSGRLQDAETALLLADEIAPNHPLTDDQWVSVLTLSGQRSRSLPYLQRLILQPNANLSYAIFLAKPEDMPAPPDDLFAKIFSVGDPLGLLGAAYTAAALGRNEQAHDLIDRCLSKRPDLIEAYVIRGMLYLDANQYADFARFVAGLPEDVQQLPGYWQICGRAAQLQNNPHGAIRCYWEVLRRQPNHDRATYQLGQALAMIGEREPAERFLSRGAKLTQLQKVAIEIFDGRDDEGRFWECAQLTEQLGRLPECRLWCRLLLGAHPQHRGARLKLQQLEREWPSPPPILLAEQDLAATFDGSRFPLPTWDASQTKPSQVVVSASGIQFVDEAQSTGLDFTYFSGEDLSTPGKRMFEYTGGGVGVLDYDRDGWPDVYLTQGSHQPGDVTQTEYLDALFRNRLGVTWAPVAGLARIVDAQFGQGLAVGDFDNDGFADLYVANIDGNRLFRNNGDGTFDDVTPQSGLGHQYWTTSCLLADINGDSIVDIYDVTFLFGDDVFDKTCKGSDGVARSCAPSGFPAAPDVVYLGNGDGTFRRLGPESGLDVADGDGLGIVAADFDHSGRLSLFVGNDGRANFFFVPQQEPFPTQRWDEIGVLSGLAFDEAGMAQACMGIAASDGNNDGLIDLFVTNFYLDSNTYYENLGSNAFSDRARSTGLREPSIDLLGFGAQFLDANRDGWEDLLLVNGHVDDFSYKDLPYKMRSQFFLNEGDRYRELLAADVGEFFNKPLLGRGLATLDWNRDGLVDALASNIGDPAVLLTNRSRDVGTGLCLRLVGNSGARDAIGARVILTIGGTPRERQLTAGDGYQASNERLVHFGCGSEPDGAHAAVEIHWPQGNTQRLAELPIRGEYLVVEGKSPLLMHP